MASFPAIEYNSWIPPDAAIAAGSDQVLVAVNSSFAVYDKSGSLLSGPWAFDSVFSHLGLPTTAFFFDPRTLYDFDSGRWLVIVIGEDGSSQQSWIMVMVSAGPDPGAIWHAYALDASLNGSKPTSNAADYPTLGIDSQAVYVGMNMFGDSGFQYSKIRILSKAQLLSGADLIWHDFWNFRNTDGTPAFTMQPAVTFGNPGVEYVVNDSYPGGSSITLWSIANPLSPAPDVVRQKVSVPTYYTPPDAEQAGTTTRLDTGDVRLQNAVYRNGSLWTTNTTAANFGSENVAAIAYYEIETAGGTAHQAGGLGADGFYYFYPAIMVDGTGNAGVVFNRSGSSEYAGIRLTGRQSWDPPGHLQPSAPLVAGIGSYSNMDFHSGRNRWGDYSAIALDPDGSAFWMLGEYAGAKNTWGTWVGSAAYPPSLGNCAAAPASADSDQAPAGELPSYGHRAAETDNPKTQPGPASSPPDLPFTIYLPLASKCR